jgi:hypothetical protein
MSLTPTPSGARNWWPAGIFAAFGLFIAGTAALIGVSVFNGMDLVAPDYYQRELRYEQQMERTDRARRLAAPLVVSYDAASRVIQVSLAGAKAGSQPAGTIELYRPAAAKEDRRIELRLDGSGRQLLDARELSPGLWRVRVTWSVDGEEFSADEKIVVKPS